MARLIPNRNTASGWRWPASPRSHVRRSPALITASSRLASTRESDVGTSGVPLCSPSTPHTVSAVPDDRQTTMNRRTLLYGLGVGLLAAPTAAEAQQAAKIPLVGLLRPGSPP